MKGIKQYMVSVRLYFAENGTRALLVNSRKEMETITHPIVDHNVQSQLSIHYLGVTTDARLTFDKHIEVTTCEASAFKMTSFGIMANIANPRRQSRRKLLFIVATSILLCGATVWAHTTKSV